MQGLQRRLKFGHAGAQLVGLFRIGIAVKHRLVPFSSGFLNLLRKPHALAHSPFPLLLPPARADALSGGIGSVDANG